MLTEYIQAAMDKARKDGDPLPTIEGLSLEVKTS